MLRIHGAGQRARGSEKSKPGAQNLCHYKIERLHVRAPSYHNPFEALVGIRFRSVVMLGRQASGQLLDRNLVGGWASG